MAFSVGDDSLHGFPCGSPPTPRPWKYHVFLSFRGEDTRRGFTDHLYASLERKGIKTFKDEKDLERGELISQELLKAIEESMIAITVLSPNYAFSTWCLDELQKIVECNDHLGLVVMPVFYGVDPSDVRHQRGTFAKAFRKHEQYFQQDLHKVERWKYSIGRVVSYSGWNSKDWYEAELVESIAECIQKKLMTKLPAYTSNLVGIVSRVEEVKRLIGMGSNDVRFVGIWGISGIGKTTIARAVYEEIQSNFEVTCFFANVRELSEAHGLVHVQKQLVSHLNISTTDFNNLYGGKKTLRDFLCNKEALLVLDDVNEVSQLESLVGNQDWFGQGSRVIITTRDMSLLRIHGVHKTYEVGRLVQNEALHLFCLKAFKQDRPKEEYFDLSKELIKFTGGIPLALKVLGSYLHGRVIDFWHGVLNHMRSYPHPTIEDILKLSYESLEPLEKIMFLDVACFFRGMAKSTLERWALNVDFFIERSFVTLEKGSDKLEMHDLLHELGKKIVLQESPDDPSKRSRLWAQGDINHVFKQNKGIEAIQGIKLNLAQPYEASWNTKSFLRKSQLKFLNLDDLQLPLGQNCFPRSLKVLQWRGFSSKALPLANGQNEFIHIELSHSKIVKLWDGKKLLEKLKHMDLSFSKNLKALSDFSGAPNLETLDLEGCTSLTSIHPSLVSHKKLVLMNLKDCTSLDFLPGVLEMISLKELILTGCSKFQNVPKIGKCMKRLSKFSLAGTAIRKLPTSLGYLIILSVLNLKDCKELVSLPNTIRELKCLKMLDISGCSKLELPNEIVEMNCLQELLASGTVIEVNESSSPSMNSCFHNWFFGSEPTSIGLRFPPSILNLSSISVMDLSYCNLSEDSIPYDFCLFSSLVFLDLSGNNFVCPPSCIPKLSKLEILKLNRCGKLQKLPELPPSIRALDASNCLSLQTSTFNPSNLFVSLLHHPSKELVVSNARFDMVIPGCEIPSWVEHQVNGRFVSVPRNECGGFALCFLLVSYADPSEECNYLVKCSLTGRDANKYNRYISERKLPPMDLPHLYIVFLTHDQFSDENIHDTHFEVGLTNVSHHPKLVELNIVSCGALLVQNELYV